LTIGKGAGTIASNTAIGNLALNSNTTGSGVTAIGSSALQTNTTGQNNIGIGANSLFANTTGGFNTAIGANSLTANTTGINNTALGNFTLSANTTALVNPSSSMALGALTLIVIGWPAASPLRTLLTSKLVGIAKLAPLNPDGKLGIVPVIVVVADDCVLGVVKVGVTTFGTDKVPLLAESPNGKEPSVTVLEPLELFCANDGLDIVEISGSKGILL
jgi:hypothetical protein